MALATMSRDLCTSSTFPDERGARDDAHWLVDAAALCGARSIALADTQASLPGWQPACPASAYLDRRTTEALIDALGHRMSFQRHCWMQGVGGAAAHAHSLVVPLAAVGEGKAFAVLGYDEADDAERRRADRLAPSIGAIIDAHIALKRELEAVRVEERAAIAALDCSDCGVIVLRADGSIVFANAAASTMIDAADGLQRQGRSLRPLGYTDAVRFRTAFDCVTSPTAGTGRRRAMMMMLPRASGDRDMLVVVASADGAGAGAGSSGFAAVVYMVAPESATAAGLDPLCRLHGLSPVETKLVHHLVQGNSVAEAATEMRIKVDTARTYLKQVFLKMRVRRQSDLVQLVTRYQRAVRDDLEIKAA